MRMYLIAAMVALGLAVPAAHATEGGASQYPNGAEDFMVGAAPPPGIYLINYTTWYSADRLNDSRGNKMPVKVRVDAVAEVPRLLWMSPHQVLGGNWGMHILMPLVHLDATVGSWSKREFGLGDITVSPAVMSWHWKNFHMVSALDIHLPTGSYNKNDSVNIGANYVGFEPVLALSYLSDDGWEASAKLMYDINTRNETTDYLSGQVFHTDYTLAKHIGGWALGVGGYYYHQTTDDEPGAGGGSNGNRGLAFAIGPQLKYDIAGKYSVIGKWQHEVLAENRAQGDKLWIKAVIPF